MPRCETVINAPIENFTILLVFLFSCSPATRSYFSIRIAMNFLMELRSSADCCPARERVRRCCGLFVSDNRYFSNRSFLWERYGIVYSGLYCSYDSQREFQKKRESAERFNVTADICLVEWSVANEFLAQEGLRFRNSPNVSDSFV